MIHRNSGLCFSLLLVTVVLFAGCGKSSVVSDTSSSSPASATPVADVKPNPPVASTASTPASAVSPTPNPVMKQASAKPGVPVPVPESMKRAMTPEEFKKAMQAMPPEVRQRLMGLQQAPRSTPSPAKK